MKPKILIEDYLLKSICDIIGNKFVLIVCDQNTFKLLGDCFEKKKSANTRLFILSGRIFASESLIDKILLSIKNNFLCCDLIVALGSGTITDICKRVSYLSNVDCILFPTAASVNAYTSSNSSIILNNGRKISLKSSLAKEIYIDLNVIFSAPKILTCSGFADLVCRTTVELDCLLSHLIFNTYYNDKFFSSLKQYEDILLDNYKVFLEDKSLVKILMEGLVFSGIGMYNAKSSIVASQGEHQIGHIIESSINNKNDCFFLHGQIIALTTLYMIKLQNKILKNNFLIKKYKEVMKQDIQLFYNNIIAEEYYSIYNKKKYILEHLDLSQIWTGLREKIIEKKTNYKKYFDSFLFLGLPTKYKDLYLDKSTYDRICKTAFFTRDRFTFLDIAYYTNTF